MGVELHDIINSGYKDANTQKNTMLKHGFVRDDQLSNHNQQTYYNPSTKKLIYNVTGTHTLGDWGTNFYLARGKLKETNRYLEAHQGLRDAKTKYKVGGATVTGDSLGGGIASLIHSRSDKANTFNKASTIAQKTRPSENSFRISGDIVSGMNANSKRTKTLKNQNTVTPSKLLNMYNAHVPSALKKSGIKII